MEMSELVEVTIKLPKAIVSFLKHHEPAIGSVEKYLRDNIIYCIEGDLENSDCAFFDPDHEAEQWNLGEVFKKYKLRK